MNLKEQLMNNPMNSPSKFIGRLFEARDVAHLEHLRVKGPGSFAAHKALNKFYDSLLDLIDGFVESYQGKYGIVNIEIKSVKPLDFMEYIQELAKYIESSRDVFKEDYLKNQIDELTSLTYSTIYKLKFLK
jgi:DNA-binding ferritin-like protein